MRMLDGKAPFARAAPILRSRDSGELLRAQRWTGGEPTGDPLTEDDFNGFVRSNQAFRWSDLGAGTVGAVPHIAVWLLRDGFDHFLSHDGAVDEVRRAGAVMADVPAPASRVRVVAVREDLANPVRDEWATRAFDRAFQQAMKGDWQAACATADLSFVVTRGLVPERVALHALALEKCSEKTDAEATLIMAEQSRGKAFGLEMRAKLEEYRRDTSA